MQMGVLWEYYGAAMAMHENTMGTPWECHDNTVGLYGNTMETLWGRVGNAIATPCARFGCPALLLISEGGVVRLSWRAEIKEICSQVVQ